MKRINALILSLLLCLAFFSSGCLKKSPGEANLSPENWPEGELEKYKKLNQIYDEPRPLGEGSKGMVVGTTGALAVRAGLEALKQGGSAADAAMTTALTQISLAAGSWVSYAGIMTMVYYEAETGKIHYMFAGYNTVQEEKNPLTIPKSGTPSGRTALVPGFMGGVQAAHDRFGKLPFAKIFEPAIYFAENGIMIDSMLARMIGYRKDVLSRLPETKQIFTKENGEFFKEGNILKQPQVAETLRKVATLGADYIYRGEWAQKFVDAVRAEGGKMTLKDLEDYQVVWSEPLRTTYKDYEIFALGSPSSGGGNTVEALNLMEASKLSEMGHYTESAEGLYWFIQFAQVPYLLPYVGLIVKKHFPEIEVTPESRLTKAHAGLLWEKMREPEWAVMQEDIDNIIKQFTEAAKSKKKPEDKPKHSDGVIAIDQEGNIAAVCHSINTASWGTTGIFVDGISIPDSANFQQDLIQKVGPGVPLPDPTNPLIVFKNGKPFLASSSIGSGLLSCTLQNLYNVLDFDMDPKTSVETPNFLFFSRDFKKRVIQEGTFSEEILNAVRKMGQGIEVLPKKEARGYLGYWIGIRIDSKTGKLEGGLAQRLNGIALGYE